MFMAFDKADIMNNIANPHRIELEIVFDICGIHVFMCFLSFIVFCFRLIIVSFANVNVFFEIITTA